MNAEYDPSSERSHDGTYSDNVHLSPDIIIYNILTRIPLKNLYRCRCVCKPWSNLFHDPLFISSYSKYASRTSSQGGFISLENRKYVPLVDEERQTTTYNFVFFDIDNKEEKLIPFRLPEKENYGDSIPGGSSIYIQHSFNGMLLISFHVPVVGESELILFVYNLVTASWLYMGIRPKWLRDSSDAILTYDPIILKYKVVVYYNRDRKFHILSDLLWSYVSLPEYLKDFTIDTFCKPVYLNYDLHWICEKLPWVNRRSNNSKEGHGKLLRLNVSTGKVSTLKLPTKDYYHSPKHRGLLEMGGLLWFFHSASDYHNVQLWYLKKKKNNSYGYEDDEWVIMFNINLMTEISLQQLQRSTSVGAKSQSSPVLLKYHHWTNCPILFVMDPKCKVVFTYLSEKHMYVCSYDTELDQGDLIYAREDQKVVYWNGNNTVLSTQ